MFQDAFIKLDTLEAEMLLDEINPELEGSNFDANVSTIMTHDLSFYPDYRFVEISDHQETPSIKRFLIYKPGDIVVLDWTNEPIYELNKRAPLALDEKNVVEYLKFFFSYVRGRHGRFIITENIDDINWREDPPPAARKAIGKILTPVCLVDTDNDGTFNLSMRVIFKDSLFKSKAHIKADGNVQLSDEELVIEDMPVIDDVLGQ